MNLDIFHQQNVEPTLSPVKGILVHRLPTVHQGEALGIFAELSVGHYSQDELGLRIFFEHYDCARKTILWRRVCVRGKSYDIFPLVTNLTIRGIRCHADKMKIKRLVEPYGPVINLYSVHDEFEEEHTHHKTIFITDDYRVILDVPEVQASYRLHPVVLPEVDSEFPISFFCRLCRQNGHKQYQCQDTAGTSGNFARLALTKRSESWPESDGSEVDHTGGDFPAQINPREFSSGTSPRCATLVSSRDCGNYVREKCSFEMSQKSDRRDPPTHQKTHVAERYVSDNYYRSTRYKNARRESHSPKRRAQVYHPPNRYSDCKNFRESTSRPVPSTRHRRKTPEDMRFSKKSAFMKDEINLPLKRSSKHERVENSKKPGTQALERDRTRCKRNSTKSVASRKQAVNSAKDSVDVKVDRRGCPSGTLASSEDPPSRPKPCSTASSMSKPLGDAKEDKACRTEGSSREVLMSATADSSRKREAIRLSVLAPPDSDPRRMRELIRVSSSYDAQTLPPEVEEALTAFLDWNNGPGSTKLNEKEVNLIRQMGHFLDRVHNARAEKVAEEPVAAAIPKCKTEAETPEKEGGETSSGRPRRARCRRTSISQGVLGIMKEVQGELNPILLENFLKQVRGRKKAADMAMFFTPNIRGLIHQLREVEKAYYVSGKRGSEDDRDIRYIKDLYLRLERDISADCHLYIKKECESTEFVVKEERS